MMNITRSGSAVAMTEPDERSWRSVVDMMYLCLYLDDTNPKR